MQQEPRTHDRKGYVGLAITNVEMATRNPQGIMPRFSIQMNSDHIDTSICEVQVKLEPFDQPARLLPIHLDVKAQPGVGLKLDLFAHQFLEPSFEGVETGRVVVRPLELAVVCLLCQIMTKLAAKCARLIDYH